MKLSTLFALNAIVGGTIGLAFLIVPVQVGALFGMTTNEVGLLMARFFGAALLGYAVIRWLVRGTPPSLARRAVMIGSIFAEFLGMVLTAIAILNGVLIPAGWLIFAVFLLFALAYSYFLTREPGEYQM